VNATPAPLPSRTVLEGQFVMVTPLDPGRHTDALYTGSRDEELWRFLFDGPFASRDNFLARMERKAASQDPLYFAIVERRSGEAAGYAAYMRITPEHRVIEVGDILYTPALQKTAGATEAMYLMARHVFEDLGYRRYEWKCHSMNAPSRRAALRFGFQFEGIFRQHMIVKGQNRDTAWYSMLDSEWPARKAAFERWLAPVNFDAEGRQRESLSRPKGQTLTES
jgi:RimJ/RimL family protein N-acetyltransferase